MTHILFPCEPFNLKWVEPDFEGEYRASLDLGLTPLLVDTDDFAVIRPSTPGKGLYRGWMFSADRYEKLFDFLGTRGIKLLTNPEQYRFCHHLPTWYDTFREHTPASIWYPDPATLDLEEVHRKLGPGPFVVKDYVKSEKHYWLEACYAEDLGQLPKIVKRFLELRDHQPEGGLVVRRFVELLPIGEDPRSGLPLTLEFRLFFWKQKLLHAQPYWDRETTISPPLPKFEALAKEVDSPFFTMDIAQDVDDRWWIIELGDGQVSGRPPSLSPSQFLSALNL